MRNDASRQKCVENVTKRCRKCNKKGRKCNKKGHIARFCKEDHPTSASTQPDTAQRTMITVKIVEQNVKFLYDTGSQYSIMRKDEYEKLKSRPPLPTVSRKGTSVNG